MDDQKFYNTFAVAAILVLLGAFAVGYLGASLSNGPPAGEAAPTAGPTNLYLTIEINPVTGWPQYSPANFTVPKGEVFVTITDYDSPAPWDGCACNVTGTVGGTESVNGTVYANVPSSNVAHSFDIPALGINVVSPGTSTITFVLELTQTGSFVWMCDAPCAYPPEGPMGVPGYMTGTMTVLA